MKALDSFCSVRRVFRPTPPKAIHNLHREISSPEDKMKNILLFIALFLIWMPVFAQDGQMKSDAQTKTADQKLPQGWGKTGTQRDHYDFYTDITVKHGGKASGTLKAKTTAPKDGFAATIQAIKPDNYRGKRIRLSGYLKTENVSVWSGFWLRLDGADPTNLLGFDNMENRPVKGTTDWKKYELVLDVPNETELVVFGVTLVGGGQAWIDDLKIEIVGNDAASTGISTAELEKGKKEGEEWFKNNPAEKERLVKTYNEDKKNRPLSAVNLDFES
jgi:hypothetical protein